MSEIGTTYALFYPFIIGLTKGANGLTVETLVAKYDSLLVDGKYYKHVIVFHETRNAPENNHQTYFYNTSNRRQNELFVTA